ncbi:Glutamate receptor ionotropic, kainate 4 [Liparis tanakae]|uniref:Glutamate receptor ionotropic, kainate 4 n=1 Tax=Liparis tanakae TaxID=230148 RepID=A0A4Z2FDP7_9TELE|nr:Glutamate receptor ionotropic, kainate 4 [Liparis tanakae]
MPIPADGFRRPSDVRSVRSRRVQVLVTPPLSTWKYRTSASGDPRTPLHPDGRGWKTNRGDMGAKCGGGGPLYGTLGTTQTGNLPRDEEAPIPAVPPGPSASSRIPFKRRCVVPRWRLTELTATTPSLLVPYVKVAPEDILKVQFPRFTTLDLRPTNTDISLAVAGLLTFFNGTTAFVFGNIISSKPRLSSAPPPPAPPSSVLAGSLPLVGGSSACAGLINHPSPATA